MGAGKQEAASKLEDLRPSDYPFPQLYVKPESACAAGETPRTDAVREIWLAKPNVELGDGRPISGNVVDVEFARDLERENAALRAALVGLQGLAIAMRDQITNGCPNGLIDAGLNHYKWTEANREALAGKAVGE